MTPENYNLVFGPYTPTLNLGTSSGSAYKTSAQKIFSKPVLVSLGSQAAIVGLTIAAIAFKSQMPAK